MPRFTFDASKVAPWRGSQHDSPFQCALRMWLEYQNADDDMSFEVACRLAPDDREIYDALHTWALETGVQTLPQALQAAVCVALVRVPPRKRKGATARRNERLRAIGKHLHETYRLPYAQAVHGQKLTACVAAVLAALPDTPSEGTIAVDILKPT